MGQKLRQRILECSLCGKIPEDGEHIWEMGRQLWCAECCDKMEKEQENEQENENETKKVNIMKLKGYYSIDESGRYTVIFEDENGEEWEVEFEVRIDKKYHYEETGRFLTDVYVQSKCLSPGFYISEKVAMEIELEEYIIDSFNL